LSDGAGLVAFRMCLSLFLNPNRNLYQSPSRDLKTG
jgi:hypothetical protein